MRAVLRPLAVLRNEEESYILAGTVYLGGNTSLLFGNDVPGKVIVLKTASSVELSDDSSATVIPGGGSIIVESDLSGLRKQR